MSRFSYSLDIGEELEREKEVKRKLAHSRERSEDEEEKVHLDPKFEQEILALAEDKPAVQEDDSIVITPAKIEKPRPVADVRVSRKVEPEPKVAPAPKTPEPKPVKEVKESVKAPKEAKEVKTQPVKAPKEIKAPKEPKEPVKVAPVKSKKLETKKETAPPAPSPLPASAPKQLPIEPRTPGDGSSRLVVALLLISVIAVILIYTGLAADHPGVQPQVACYQQWANDNKLDLISFNNMSEARQYWFTRALSADNEAEAAALMRMVLCEKDVTKDSNPLDYLRCAPSHLFVIDEDDVRAVANISAPSQCDSLGTVITCDNGYIVDGIIAFGAEAAPKYFVAKTGGAYTVVSNGNKTVDEALTVMSDREGKFVAFTLPSQNRNVMALKFFVGDEFTMFGRAYLDHADGNRRTLVYALR